MKETFFLLLISGCSYLEQPVSEKIIKKGWGRTCPVEKKAYYCYNTLGECVCYKEPLLDVSNRLTGQPYIYKKVPVKKNQDNLCEKNIG